jgi:hypothetical protein
MIENGQVLAEGLISRDTSWARDVSKSAVSSAKRIVKRPVAAHVEKVYEEGDFSILEIGT